MTRSAPSGPRSAFAFAFVQFLASAESQAIFASKTGYVPVNEGSAETEVLKAAWSKYPALRVAYDEMLSIPSGPSNWNPLVGPRPEVRLALSNAAEAVWNGKDPDAALQEAVIATDTVLSTYNSAFPQSK